MVNKTENADTQKIEDGQYKVYWNGSLLGYIHVSGDEIQFENEAYGVPKGSRKSKIILKYGSFENMDKRGLTGTNKVNYSVYISIPSMEELMNLCDLYANFIPNEKSLRLQTGELMEYMDEEAIKNIKDGYEETDEYEHFYKLQPENQGKIVVISGGAGYGKSSVAEILRKDHDFVFYEGDCFFFRANPYAKMSPKGPSFWGTKQLKQVPNERKEAMDALTDEVVQYIIKEEVPSNYTGIPIYTLMAEDILKEKAKIGGDWVIPLLVHKREVRDHMREKLGDQCIFIIFKVDEELQLKRLAMRNFGKAGGEVSKEAVEAMAKEIKARDWTKGFENWQEGEKNAVELVIHESMTPRDIADAVLKIIKQF